MQSGSWSLCMREKRRRAFHEPAVPERGSVTRRTWGCSDVLRLTEPRSHRVVRFMVPDACEKTKEGSLHEPAVARELPVRSADRDRSPVAACGPRQHPWKITHALVFARPLRAGTARGPNLIGSWSQCMRESGHCGSQGSPLSHALGP